MSPIIVTLDIETAPLLVYSWGVNKQFVSIEQIHTDWSILSFAAKRLDQKVVLYRDNRGQKNVRDDKGLMVGLWSLLNEADIIVAQNGKRFDIKKINARFAIHGLTPPSPYRVVDTLLEARKVFGFTSNKLAHLSKCLTESKKSSHKRFPGLSLWLACLDDNEAAWKEMARYNKRDVVATEELYLKLRPWIAHHPNVVAFDDSETVKCPKCNSEDVQKRGFSFTNLAKYARIRCNSCKGWSRGRDNLLSKSKRKTLLA